MRVSRFLDFIKYAIDTERQFIPDTEGMDWLGLYKFAEEQAILGVVFKGVERLGEQGVKPPFDLLMQWIATVEQIEGRNKAVNKVVLALFEKLNNDGFRGCVLKGQGNNLMYPNVYSRTPGDIDVWVSPVDVRGNRDDVKCVVGYVRQHNHQAKAVYHHIDYGLYKDVEVEVHYRPSFMFNPIYNRRLKKWFRVNANEQLHHVVELPDGVGEIAVPTTDFNIIYQLSHIYNHLLHEGIGLRQIIDYYYVLKTNTSRTNDTNIIDLLNYLGLAKIAGTVMWALHDKLGLEEEFLIAPMDEERGKVLLEEVLRGGNFGHYDDNNRQATTAIKKNIQRLKRDFRMMRYFPSECFWEPIFRVYHFFWRLRYN